MNASRLRPLVLVLAVGLPGTVAALALLWTGAHSEALRWTLSVALVLAWLAGAFFLRAQIHRPLRTVSSMLAALRAGRVMRRLELYTHALGHALVEEERR